jgi:hypothetical protein
MKTVQRLLFAASGLSAAKFRATVLIISLPAFALVVGSCGTSAKRVVYPERLHSPYAASGQVVWAVVPPRNESGVSVVDELSVGDALVEEIGQVKGLDCLPLNRTINAMRSLGLASIDSPAQAKALARATGADAVVVSTITSWQPYQPPRIGLNVALFARSGSMGVQDGFTGDVRAIQASATPSGPPGLVSGMTNGPVSGVSVVLDASNTAIMRKVEMYGEARVEPNDPMGWERYSKSMRLYTRFACHRAVELLLDAERGRVAPTVVPPPERVTDAAEKADPAR